MKRAWTKPKIRELHALYMASPVETYRSIGARLGITPQAVAHLFKREGLPSRGLGNQVGEVLLHRRAMKQRGRLALSLRREDKTTVEIRAELDIPSRNMLHSALRTLDEAGIPWRKRDIVEMEIRAVKERPVEGECRIKGCARPPAKRGLCARCHRRAWSKGLLDVVGTPSRSTQGGPKA